MIRGGDPAQRFCEKVSIDGNGCWKWQSRVRPDGYGTFWFKGKTEKAHVVSYQLFVEAIPKGFCVLHKCDVRDCVNPAHLSVGTVADNIHDMDAKGRRGSRAKLTLAQSQDIQQLLESGMSQQNIAEMYGVTQTAISRVKLGRTTYFAKE